MASQHATSLPAAPASLVGNAFVIRYYNILHQTPHLGYRFYTEESRISRAEPRPETAVESATSLSAIHEKIMSLDHHATRTEIMTVDTQESLAGGVLVMVTGAVYNAGGVRRMFVQTFVLVPQERSYFIFNDMFKFLDGDSKSMQQLTPPVVSDIPPVASDTPKLRDPPANPIGMNESSAIPRSALVSDSIETVIAPGCSSSYREQEDIPIENDHYKLQLQNEISDVLEATLDKNAALENIIEDQGDVLASKSNESQDVVDVVEEATNVEETPKKSYASILRLQKIDSKSTVLATSAANMPKLLSTHIERSTSSQEVQSAAQPSLGERMLSPDHVDELNGTEAEGDGGSVYVKNLPLNITLAELEDEFSKFGHLKSGGVNLRNQRIGVCYAFIEFEEASSAHSAVEASPINMNGRQVYIEEKRIFPSRGGRGRPNQGRGNANDGVRGRGFFSNGRGMGRHPLESDKENSRGRGLAIGRNGYGGGSFPVPHALRQNSNSFRPMRRAGNQMGRNGPLARNGIMVAAA